MGNLKTGAEVAVELDLPCRYISMRSDMEFWEEVSHVGQTGRH